MTPKLAVIVPVCNDAAHIEAVLGELRSWLAENEPDAEIIVVDDGSDDGSADAARAALSGFAHRVERHEHNRGIGAALKTGVRATEATFVMTLPADGRIEPRAIGQLRAAQREHDADLVLSVYPPGTSGLDRAVLTFGVRALIFLVHGVPLRSEGPYLFRRTLFDPEQLKPNTHFLHFEFPLRAVKAGLKTHTITIARRAPIASPAGRRSAKHAIGAAKDLLSLRVRRTREAWDRARGKS